MPKIFRPASLVFAFLVALIAFPAAALAQASGDPDPLALLRVVWDAISASNYQLAAAGAVVLIGAVLTRWGGQIWSWFSTGTGRAAIVLLTSFGAALFAAVQSGAAISIAVLWAALKLGATAAGVYSLAKALVLEPLQRWVTRGAPGFVGSITKAIAWLINRVAPSDPPTVGTVSLEVQVRPVDTNSLAQAMADEVAARQSDKS